LDVNLDGMWRRDRTDGRGRETDAAAVVRLQQITAQLESQVEALTRSVQQQQPQQQQPAAATSGKMAAGNSTQDVVITMIGSLGFSVGSRFVRSLRETGSRCDVVLMMPEQVPAHLNTGV
jgi:hypothetical protein